MKKTISGADGSKETVEGSPEEIAEYERLREERAKRERKPEVLKGSSDLEKLLELWQTVASVPRPTYPQPIWIVSCPICSHVNCVCNRWFPTPFVPTFVPQFQPWLGGTHTVSGDSIVVADRPERMDNPLGATWVTSKD